MLGTGIKRTVVCSHCGRIFDTTHPRQKFCSSLCKQQTGYEKKRLKEAEDLGLKSFFELENNKKIRARAMEADRHQMTYGLHTAIINGMTKNIYE